MLGLAEQWNCDDVRVGVKFKNGLVDNNLFCDTKTR